MIKLASFVAAIATTIAIASPASALQYCELHVGPNEGGPWTRVIRADRGEPFGHRTVNKFDDGDTCRSQGRRIGPNICQEHNQNWYEIRGRRNGGRDLEPEANPC